MKPVVPDHVKKKRVARIMGLGEALKQKYAERFEGRTVKAVPETFNKQKTTLKGYTEHYIEVSFKGEESMIGTFVLLKAVKAENGEICGEIIKTF